MTIPKIGPSEGERVLFCQHADVDEDHIDISSRACAHQPFHWYYFEDESASVKKSSQDDGSQVEMVLNWLCICDQCNDAGLADSGEIVGSDAPWIGEPPHITPELLT